MRFAWNEGIQYTENESQQNFYINTTHDQFIYEDDEN